MDVCLRDGVCNVDTSTRSIWWGRQWNDTLNMFNSLRPRQNGRLFADDTFKRIFVNENIRISTENSLKLVPKCLINNIPALVLIMAWRRPGDKPLSEPMLVRSLTHICVTRPQWVNVCRMKNISMGITGSIYNPTGLLWLANPKIIRPGIINKPHQE